MVAMSMATSSPRYWFRRHIGMEVAFAVTVVVNVEVHCGKTGMISAIPGTDYGLLYTRPCGYWFNPSDDL